MQSNDRVSAPRSVCNNLPFQQRKMPPKAPKVTELHEKQLARAVDYAHKHPKESKAKVAKAYGVNATTLRRRCKGSQVPRSKARRKQQLLTGGEEDAVVDWCGRMADMGFPVTVRMLLSMAVAILRARGNQLIPGPRWPGRFFSRHPTINLKYVQYLEKVRAKVSATVEELETWYRKLRHLMRQYKIEPQNLWNCDEKGIIMGLAVGRQKAIVRSSARQKVAVTDGNREFCSVLESVNAIGEVIPPFVVWANKVHCVGFYGDDSRPATFSRSPSGYMDDELGFDFISKHFDHYTTPIPSIDLTMADTTETRDTTSTTPGPSRIAPPGDTSYRMLIVDGHSSHIAWPVVEYALDHRIILYCLPAHSTHLMQPLDVACFGPLARAYRSALQSFIYDHPGQAFGKQEFWECLCTARSHALTKTNILSGFAASGLWPFQPEKVINRSSIKTEPVDLTTPLKVATIRSTISQLAMTPHSRSIV